MTEDQAGSDAFALATTAHYIENEYVITGVKSYITNGSIADFILVYAKTAPNKGHWGISCFLVKTTNQGIVQEEPFEKIGLNSAPASKVHFNNCKVSSSYRLGSEGEGAAIFNYSMQWERACLFAIYLGMIATARYDNRICKKT